MPSDQLEQTAGFLVSGRVQRVGFRWWTRHTATRLGLSGTVRNLVDGKVEIQVRGSADAIRQLHELLNMGPPTAVIEGVETFQVTGILRAGFHLLP